MNPNKEDVKNLIDVWVLCKSKSSPGRKYYFNKKNGKAYWTEPEVLDTPSSSKKSHRLEKNLTPDKNKKEEIRKRCHKGKRENNARKIKKESIQKETKSSCVLHNEDRKNYLNSSANTSKDLHSQKCRLKKNLANNRLSQLRQRLSLELERDNNTTSKAKRSRSPDTSAYETPNKIQKNDIRSPNVNDSKCTVTSQSPSSESLQSTSSPSQFFTANKIISSIKSQLSEEYNNKEKQRDTFADIEEGIYNQMPEYPCSKHISTPPQFSEATKLVSAIKSKLAYKKPVHQEDSTRKSYSAKERMQSLRTSLSVDVPKTKTVISLKDCPGDRNHSEPMEVEYTKVALQPKRSSVSEHENENKTMKTNLVLVVDTNIFIHELNFIKNVLNSHIKGYVEQPTLLVPWRVINELDRLKDNNNGKSALCKRARCAMDFLYNSIPENNRVKGQSLRDANSHIYPCEVPDDEILNCCLQQAERGKSVILMSNDKNLCNKATINNIRRMSISELKALLESKPQAVVDPELHAIVEHCERAMYELLSNILENELRAKYMDLWLRVVYKPPPWQLLDVLQLLLKHWVAVFQEVFPRIEHLFSDLEGSITFIKNKKPDALSQSEVKNFKDLCIDIAKKCQIIPEYMELAKRTVQKLMYGKGTHTNHEGGSKTTVQAFENVWIVFSSYSAKLATSMGVPHNIEDQLPGNDAAEALISKWSMYRNQINALTLALKGVLSVDNSDLIIEEHISRLEAALKSSLTLISMDTAVVREELRLFCVKNRDMLKEACNKLTQLTDMLDVCKMNIHN